MYFSLFDAHLNFGNLLWGCAANKITKKIETLQKRCIRNVALANFKSHTEPLFKRLSILKYDDKIVFGRSVFMNQYRNKTLPESFLDIFTDITSTDNLQTRHNDYNYQNIPAVRRNLENFPFKCMIKTWNSLNIDVKSTADKNEFELILKEILFSKYNHDLQCEAGCYSCNT